MFYSLTDTQPHLLCVALCAWGSNSLLGLAGPANRLNESCQHTPGLVKPGQEPGQAGYYSEQALLVLVRVGQCWRGLSYCVILHRPISLVVPFNHTVADLQMTQTKPMTSRLGQNVISGFLACLPSF